MRAALVMLKLRTSAAEAKKRLKAVKGNLRKAMGD
jgi:N-acetylmuramic acid 6-phosphate (MurNAc-6-P) etherase